MRTRRTLLVAAGRPVPKGSLPSRQGAFDLFYAAVMAAIASVCGHDARTG